MNENSLELFSLLSDTPQVSKEEMQNAYKHFTEQIIAISQSEQSYHEIFRKLNITRIEFDSLKSSSFWKSHATLTLLATQDLPTFGYNMIDPLKSWCWGSILFYPFKISRFS